MKRAFADPISCYTMANCEKLSYEACTKIEQLIDAQADITDKRFCLVFLYASEAGNVRIRGILDRYYRKHLNDMVSSDEDLRNYIAEAILRPKIEHTACTADPQR